MKLSIVVPVYNNGAMAARMIKSLLAQSFTDFEIIVIDDGSTDNTRALLLETAQGDARVSVYSIANRGPGGARNAGVERCRGEYVMFADSDDLFAGGALEKLMNTVRKTHPDLLIFGFIITDSNLVERKRYSFKDGLYDLREDPGCLTHDFIPLYQRNLLNQVWNKVYSRQMLLRNKIHFTNHRYGEDRLFVLDVMKSANRIVVLNEYLYFYVDAVQSSLSRRFYARKLECCREIGCRIYDLAALFGVTDKHAVRSLDYMYFKSMVSCIVQLFDKSCDYTWPQKKEYMKAVLSDPRLRGLKNIGLRFGLFTYILYLCLKSRLVWLNACCGRFVAFVGKKFPNFFLHTKHRF